MTKTILRVLRPHWKALSIALVAALAQGAAGLLEPWPLKLVFDYVIGSKSAPAWVALAVVGVLAVMFYLNVEFTLVAPLLVPFGYRYTRQMPTSR